MRRVLILATAAIAALATTAPMAQAQLLGGGGLAGGLIGSANLDVGLQGDLNAADSAATAGAVILLALYRLVMARRTR